MPNSKYTFINPYYKNRAIVTIVTKIGKKEIAHYGLIDENQNEIIPPVYEQLWLFHEGLAGACRGKKWGF
jgi:hypothetical protein